MLNLEKIVFDGGLFAIVGGLYILAIMRISPRLFLNPGDMPPDILAAVPPKTAHEKRLAAMLGIPFLIGIFAVPLISTWQFEQQAGGALLVLFVHALGILLMFNLFDLLILDFVLFCTLTPRFMVVPGTEGFAGSRTMGFTFASTPGVPHLWCLARW